MKKVFGILLAVVFGMALLTGCGASDWNPLKQGKELNIAFLGSSGKFEERQDFIAGVDLAIKELSEKGVNIKYKLFNDDDNYDNGVTNAKQVVNDDTYAMAFTFQSFEIVDTVASLFDEAGKPLFIINGCYDRTMESGYKYVMNLTISAEDGGIALGKYVVNHGYKWIAVAHSNSEYAIDFQEGFNDAVSGSGATNVIDSVSGPNKATEFDEVWARWQILGVDAVVLSFDDMDWAVELVKMIKEKDPNMMILGDQYFNDLSYMNEYGKYLDGMVMPSSYPVDSDAELQRFYDKYEPQVQYLDITSVTAQGYDLTNMIAKRLENANSSEEFVEGMLSVEAYDGYTDIKFKQNGSLDKEPKYWVVKNNVVYREESLK
ncbi:MAG: amino acid ABC transporter substrate-binding protein [Clostridia bacterium]|nr:amino acid ABC transporter substrate-binding protein [Clostridia bacterium]